MEDHSGDQGNEAWPFREGQKERGDSRKQLPEASDESKETTFCIKGHDYLQRLTYNQYTLISEISQTAYTTIYLCQKNHTFEKFVMKQLRRGYMRKVDREAYLNSMREIDIHKLLNHPCIIRLHEIIDDEGDDKVHLIMEFAEGGQLLTYDKEMAKFWFIGRRNYTLPEEEVRRFAKQMIEGLAYLHQKKVMHLDIKPLNFLLDPLGNAKIADLGSAQMFYQEEDTLLTHRGTYEFLAPECFKMSKNTKYYSGRAADVWAMGMTIYALAFGELPFEVGLGVQTKDKVQEMQLTFEEEKYAEMSADFKSFLLRMLVHNPAERAKSEDLLKEPFLVPQDLF